MKAYVTPRAQAIGIDSSRPPHERYQVLGRIAMGGMAEIYLGHVFTSLGWREVVLKRLLPSLQEDREFVEMFFDEAQIASQLSHKNIVEIFELGELGGSFFIAMELVHGVNLHQLHARAKDENRRLPIPIALRIACGALEALNYAHNFKVGGERPLHVVHRDISPHNILVTYDGGVKLLDFGVAKAEGRLHKTRIGFIKGKCAYMAPEQIAADKIDGRSDLFALGEVLFELLLNCHPFEAASEPALFKLIFEGRPLDPEVVDPSFPPALRSILLRALESDPKKRFQDAETMQRAIEDSPPAELRPAAPQELGEFVRTAFASRIKLEKKARENMDLRLLIQALEVDPKDFAQAKGSSKSKEPRVSDPSRAKAPPRPSDGPPAKPVSVKVFGSMKEESKGPFDDKTESMDEEIGLTPVAGALGLEEPEGQEARTDAMLEPPIIWEDVTIESALIDRASVRPVVEHREEGEPSPPPFDPGEPSFTVVPLVDGARRTTPALIRDPVAGVDPAERAVSSLMPASKTSPRPPSLDRAQEAAPAPVDGRANLRLGATPPIPRRVIAKVPATNNPLTSGDDETLPPSGPLPPVGRGGPSDARPSEVPSAPVSASTPAGTVLLSGQYTIVQRLALGTRSELFLARQDGPHGLKRNVVLRRLLSRLAADRLQVHTFFEEARLAGCLSHRNIVQLFDLGTSDGHHYAVVELVEGWDLKRIVRQCRLTETQIPPPIACYVAAEICAGLSEAHAHTTEDGQAVGLVRRDLSSKHVLISTRGAVKLTHSGLLRADTVSAGSHDPPDHPALRDARRLGIQALGAVSDPPSDDPRADHDEAPSESRDVHAAGALLYEMLRLEALDERTVPPGARRPRFPSTGSAPGTLERIVERAIATESRYPTAHAVELDLRRALMAFDRPITGRELASFARELFASGDGLGLPLNSGG